MAGQRQVESSTHGLTARIEDGKGGGGLKANSSGMLTAVSLSVPNICNILGFPFSKTKRARLFLFFILKKYSV